MYLRKEKVKGDCGKCNVKYKEKINKKKSGKRQKGA